MNPRWFLSQVFVDANGATFPVCAAYGAQWMCPTFPSEPNGWALVCMVASPAQIAAAAQDPQVVVCPLLFDPSPIDSRITDAYASWGATAGMSMGALLAALAAKEPVFGQSL